MITKQQLEKIGFCSKDGTEYFDIEFEYLYDIKTQELFEFCEVNGDTFFLCRITDIKKLEELVFNLNY